MYNHHKILHLETHPNPENLKENYKGKNPSQVSKGNLPIAKNKAIKKGSKSHKRLPTHIRKIIAKMTPIQKSNRPRKYRHKSEKTEKIPKNHNIGKTT
jgi:hypothetical protein